LFSLLEARLAAGAAGAALGDDVAGAAGAEDEGCWAGLVVADLYAGSGGLGLEAVSRGAARAVLVESSRAAARIAGANAADLGLSERVTVLSAPVEQVLARRSLPGKTSFDLVFLDPPYGLPGGQLDQVLARLALARLSPGGLIVLERSTRDGVPVWPSTWKQVDRRVYGDTVIYLAQVAESDSAG
jgi:16S rRNA (guanine966-N2)-methyltransferase